MDPIQPPRAPGLSLMGGPMDAEPKPLLPKSKSAGAPMTAPAVLSASQGLSIAPIANPQPTPGKGCGRCGGVGKDPGADNDCHRCGGDGVEPATEDLSRADEMARAGLQEGPEGTMESAPSEVADAQRAALMSGDVPAMQEDPMAPAGPTTPQMPSSGPDMAKERMMNMMDCIGPNCPMGITKEDV